MSNSPGAGDGQLYSSLEKLLHGRFSCRAYLPDQVPQQDILALLSLAQRTPSWCNTQPWRLTITRGAGTLRLRHALHSHAKAAPPARPDLAWPREYVGASLRRRRETGFALYSALGIARDDVQAREDQALMNFRFFDAPHVALITSDEALGTYGAVDCGGYVANFLLAAQACGLGAVAQAAPTRYSDFFRSYFNWPADRSFVCAVSFGYPDRGSRINQFRTGRADSLESIDWADQ